MSKFERDELERRLKSALDFALEDYAWDPDLSVRVDGPFAVVTQLAEDGEPLYRFEVRFDIREVD
jgi:hypothetical protein